MLLFSINLLNLKLFNILKSEIFILFGTERVHMYFSIAHIYIYAS